MGKEEEEEEEEEKEQEQEQDEEKERKEERKKERKKEREKEEAACHDDDIVCEVPHLLAISFYFFFSLLSCQVHDAMAGARDCVPGGRWPSCRAVSHRCHEHSVPHPAGAHQQLQLPAPVPCDQPRPSKK